MWERIGFKLRERWLGAHPGAISHFLLPFSSLIQATLFHSSGQATPSRLSCPLFFKGQNRDQTVLADLSEGVVVVSASWCADA